MKANLIIKLIEAHCSGQEVNFKEALLNLAKDEEAKGNVALASSIRLAYQTEKTGGMQNNVGNSAVSNAAFFTQTAHATVSPRDRDSLLELYEIITPDIEIDQIILPKKQKEQLHQILEEQKKADILDKRGVSAANRLLLCGPPGCGKTMTAMALAKEMNLPLAYVRLDGLVSSYLGQTSTNLRKVFDSVRNQRIVLFLDEFDAIAKKRDDAHELGELKRVVTTLLQNFDNMPSNVFLIAATNHHHLLDPAIWRRFNAAIILELPDQEQRRELLLKWLGELDVRTNIDVNLISKITEGLNGSQLQELVRAVAKNSIIQDDKCLQNEDLIDAFIKQTTLYSNNNHEFWVAVQRLNQRGISLRVLERALGIPKSTISYNLKEEDTDE